MFLLSAQYPFLSFSTFTLKQDLTPLNTHVYKTMINRLLFRCLGISDYCHYCYHLEGVQRMVQKKERKQTEQQVVRMKRPRWCPWVGGGQRSEWAGRLETVERQPERTQPLLAAKVCRAAASPSTVHLRP